MSGYLPYYTVQPKLSFAHEESKILGEPIWLNCETFSFVFTMNGEEVSVTVPKGYLTDLASIPRILWVLLPPFGQYMDACIVHDRLCEYGEAEINGKPFKLTRAEADEILRVAMDYHNVSWWNKKLIYFGVRFWAKLTRRVGPVLNKEKKKLEKYYLC